MNRIRHALLLGSAIALLSSLTASAQVAGPTGCLLVSSGQGVTQADTGVVSGGFVSTGNGGSNDTPAIGTCNGETAFATVDSVNAALANLSTSGLTSVSHDGTLAGDGTASNPLGVSQAFINRVANAQTTADTAEGLATTALSNVGQLGVTTAANLGGGVAYNASTGALTSPAYTLGGATYTDVGSALRALANGAAGPVQYSNAGSPTTPNGGTPSQDLTLVGAAGGPVALHNVAAGSLAAGSTDAVNGGQINTVGNSIASIFGGATAFNPTTGQVTGASFGVNGSNYATVTGAFNAVNNDLSGGGIKYFHTNSALADSSPAGANSVAIGPVALAGGLNSVALGNGAVANNANDVALGAGSITQAPSVGPTDITGGKAAGTAKTNGVVSVGASGAERQIQNVAAGSLSATSTDAVNGSQLFSVASAGNATGSTVASVLGNGATYAPGQGVSGFQSHVAGGVQTNVGAALSALDQMTVQYTPDAKGNPTGSINLVTSALPAGTKAVAVTGVAAGGLTATSTDAVNGSQLFSAVSAANATGATVASMLGDGTVYVPGKGVSGFQSNVAGGAQSNVGAALTALDGAQKTQGAGITSALGGGASVAANGAVTGPAYVVGGATYSNVGSALAATNKLGVQYSPDANGNPTASINLVTASLPPGTKAVAISGVAAGALTAQSTDAVNGSQLYATNQSLGALGRSAVQYDGPAGSPNTSSVTFNPGGAPTTLHNIAGGSVAPGSTDAVNGGQLYALGDAVGNRLTSDEAQILKAQQIARGAGAVGLAAAAMHFDDRIGSVSIGAAGGVFDGVGAIAAGLNYTVTKNLRLTGTAAFVPDTHDFGGAVAAVYTIY
jgi:autotransporter adhesin